MAEVHVDLDKLGRWPLGKCTSNLPAGRQGKLANALGIEYNGGSRNWALL